MFTFINTSRVGTAVQGVAAAEGSFQNALPYAKERLAMRSLSGVKNPTGPADAIIEHPDVRRMLLTQKAIAEGGRSMIYECALLADKLIEAEMSGDDAARRAVDDKMGFLTPILKGFLTEKGVEAANLGIQVFGGHGYIKSNNQERILRDVRIAAVWEGTTGIQALDLLGRKVMMQKLKPLNSHCMDNYRLFFNLAVSGSSPSVKGHARTLLLLNARWQALTLRVAAAARANKDAVGVASVDYLMYSGYVTLARHWLMMEEAAAKKLAANDGDADFYRAKIATAAFYFDNVLPRVQTHRTAALTPVQSVMGLHKDHFSFDHSL